MNDTLSHLDAHGKATMVDVGSKAITDRVAVAGAQVHMGQAAWNALLNAEVAKGDVLATARIAGIMAAKNTAQLIPLCHPLGLDQVTVEFNTDKPCIVAITAQAKVSGKTGIEMEAMTAATVAALTIYDMLKAIEKGIAITEIRLLSKSGGKSGTWQYAD